MSKIRFITAIMASLAMAFSTFGYGNTVRAENDASSAPVLHEAEAENTGGTSAIEAGDGIILEFSETTNKFPITASNIMTEFKLSNSHSFLDGAGAISGATWSVDGEELTITLSAGTSFPSVVVGDTVTVMGSNIKDLSGLPVTGDAVVDGSFTSVHDDEEECVPKASPVVSVSSHPDDDMDEEDEADEEDVDEDDEDDEEEDDDDDIDEDEDDEKGEDGDEDEEDEEEDCDDDKVFSNSGRHNCGTGLQNGKLYRLEGSQTVYMLHNCQLFPFRGEAAFKSRGHKFQEVSTISALPSGQAVSTEPVVPAEGTLVKGSDATVWFISKSGKRQGFVNSQVFLGLGFKFAQVDEITDSDLGTIQVDSDLISNEASHPDGALVKCGNSPAVFAVIDSIRFPFANMEAFRKHGHDFDHVIVVDCGRFAYQEGAPVTE